MSRAIGSCCLLDRNCHTFGRLDVVLPISKYIHSDSKLVKENVTFALHGLSGDAANCVAMESCGVVPVRWRSTINYQATMLHIKYTFLYITFFSNCLPNNCCLFKQNSRCRNVFKTREWSLHIWFYVCLFFLIISQSCARLNTITDDFNTKCLHLSYCDINFSIPRLEKGPFYNSRFKRLHLCCIAVLLTFFIINIPKARKSQGAYFGGYF